MKNNQIAAILVLPYDMDCDILDINGEKTLIFKSLNPRDFNGLYARLRQIEMSVEQFLEANNNQVKVKEQE